MYIGLLDELDKETPKEIKLQDECIENTAKLFKELELEDVHSKFFVFCYLL